LQEQSDTHRIIRGWWKLNVFVVDIHLGKDKNEEQEAVDRGGKEQWTYCDIRLNTVE
jgi:hypothetical protein